MQTAFILLIFFTIITLYFFNNRNRILINCLILLPIYLYLSISFHTYIIHYIVEKGYFSEFQFFYGNINSYIKFSYVLLSLILPNPFNLILIILLIINLFKNKIFRLDKMLIKSFMKQFIISFLIALFILLMQFLWKWVDELIGKGLEISVILELIYYTSSRFVPIAFPIAILISSIMTFGNLGEKNELSAIKSLGISLQRTLLPLIVVCLIISSISFVYLNYTLPVANLKAGSLLFDIQKKKPSVNIVENEFYNDIDGFSIKVNKKNNDTLLGVIIYDHNSQHTNDNIILAKTSTIFPDDRHLNINLNNGTAYSDLYSHQKDKDFEHQTLKFKKMILRFSLKDFDLQDSDERMWKDHYSMMNVTQLYNSIDTLSKIIKNKDNLFLTNFRKKINKENQNNNVDSNKIFKYSISNYNQSISSVKMNKSIIKSHNDDIDYRKKVVARHEIELHRKFTLPFSCILLLIIGSSIGSIIRKGGFGIPILISIFIFIILHVINITGEKQVKEMITQPLIGMWIGNVIFTPIAFILLYKAINDRFINKIKWFDLKKPSIFVKK